MSLTQVRRAEFLAGKLYQRMQAAGDWREYWRLYKHLRRVWRISEQASVRASA